MKDSTLLKISLIISILGILILFFIADTSKIKDVDVKELEDYKDKTVKIKGVVEQVTNTESATFVKVKQSNLVEVVVFEALNLSKGNYVEVTGKVDEYNDEYEILADKIKVR